MTECILQEDLLCQWLEDVEISFEEDKDVFTREDLMVPDLLELEAQTYDNFNAAKPSPHHTNLSTSDHRSHATPVEH